MRLRTIVTCRIVPQSIIVVLMATVVPTLKAQEDVRITDLLRQARDREMAKKK